MTDGDNATKLGRRRKPLAVPTEDASQALIDAQNGPYLEVRTHAPAGIAKLTDERRLPALGAALQDSVPEMRKRAVKRLAELDESEASLRAALLDRDATIRKAADGFAPDAAEQGVRRQRPHYSMCSGGQSDGRGQPNGSLGAGHPNAAI